MKEVLCHKKPSTVNVDDLKNSVGLYACKLQASDCVDGERRRSERVLLLSYDPYSSKWTWADVSSGVQWGPRAPTLAEAVKSTLPYATYAFDDLHEMLDWKKEPRK